MLRRKQKQIYFYSKTHGTIMVVVCVHNLNNQLRSHKYKSCRYLPRERSSSKKELEIIQSLLVMF
jgi:endonuclease/exonuclease/phosphatase (EEP) superfamily protein YafD